MTGKQHGEILRILSVRADVAEHLKSTLETIGENVYLTYPNGAKLRIGRNGGVDVVNVRTYPNASIAAVTADSLYDKQNGRDSKKTIAPAVESAEFLAKRIAEDTAKLAKLTPAVEPETPATVTEQIVNEVTGDQSSN